MNKTPENGGRAPDGDQPNGKREAGGVGWLTVAGSLVSLGAVVLALLGYGVAIAVEEWFSLPRSTVFESVLDLTDMSSVVIAQMIIHGLPKALSVETVWEVYRQSGTVILSGMAGWLLATAVMFLFGRRRGKRKRLTLPAMKTPRPAWLRFLLLIVLWPLAPLGIVIVILFIVTGTALLATAPLLGLAAAERHFRDYVVGPEACVPVRNREALLRVWRTPAPRKKGGAGSSDQVIEHRASCVAVSKDGKPLVKGRVVVSTPRALVLFDPKRGFADRVPTNDAVVRPIGSLDEDIPWPTPPISDVQADLNVPKDAR